MSIPYPLHQGKCTVFNSYVPVNSKLKDFWLSLIFMVFFYFFSVQYIFASVSVFFSVQGSLVCHFIFMHPTSLIWSLLHDDFFMSKVQYWATLKILFLNLKHLFNNEMKIQVLWKGERCFSKYYTCVEKLQVLLPLFMTPEWFLLSLC